jgi:16S rRNA (guanine527-N7)-methyltransferase
MEKIDLNKLKKTAELSGVDLDDIKLQQFQLYYELLISWNEKMNLTAITDKDEVMYKHFADSLLLSKYMNLNDKKTVIDVGTGAGFPGIPLKIAFPQIELTLMDSLNKRLVFLDEVIKQLELKNVETVHMRAEEAGQNENYREKYDLVVSRAVAHMSVLSEYCVPFAKIGGYFVAYKAGGSTEEIKEGKKAVRTLGGRIENIFETTVPDTELSRCFVFIKKEENTPAAYPRKSNVISKKQLK